MKDQQFEPSFPAKEKGVIRWLFVNVFIDPNCLLFFCCFDALYIDGYGTEIASSIWLAIAV